MLLLCHAALFGKIFSFYKNILISQTSKECWKNKFLDLLYVDQYNNFHCLYTAKWNVTFHGHLITQSKNLPDILARIQSRIESYTWGWVDWISFTIDLSPGTRWPSTSAARTPCLWSEAAPSRRASRRTSCRAKLTRWPDPENIFESWQIFSSAPGGGEDSVRFGGLVAGHW